MITGYGQHRESRRGHETRRQRLPSKAARQRRLVLKTVAKALEKQQLASENRRLRRQLLHQRRGIEALIGDSGPIEAVKQLIRQIAPTDINVLIQGEKAFAQARKSPLMRCTN